jgi:predicted component of viral defense system (DUF524 family)
MLAKVINGEEAKPKFRIKEGPQGGLAVETEADLGEGYKLVYNKTCEGYTFNFRPDFLLIKERKLEVVFDAKFRFDLKEKELDVDLKKLEEEAIGEGNLEKLVKVEDLYKMHTYRDALQCRASIVVYPGDNRSTEVMFYHSENKNFNDKRVKIGLSSILCSSTCGVGYMGLRPS